MVEYLAVATPQKELGTRAEARTKEVKRCLKMNPEWILMLDSDQTLPFVTLTPRAWESEDVVVFDAPNKGQSDSNVFYHPDGTLSHFTISCCFIRPSVFEKLEKPWFRSDLAYILDGQSDGKNIVLEQKKAVDDGIGEDVYFSRKLIEIGAKIYIVPSVKSKHFDLDAKT